MPLTACDDVHKAAKLRVTIFMKWGDHILASQAVLAPMAGVTDRPFRQLCRKFGAGMAVSEMITCDKRLWKTAKSMHRMDYQGEQTPISVQIVGSDPHMMAQAARDNVSQGAEIIDINMGCPAKKVCRKAAGSALLRNEKLVESILKAVVSAVDIPVTLKIRTGWDEEHKNASTIAQIAEDSGIKGLSIHGRTRVCSYQSPAEYDTIANIKRTVSIPVLANGDVDSAESAKKIIEHTGVDGVMIGRAAQGRPWIFDEINHYLLTGELLAPKTLEKQYEIVKGHLLALHAFYGEHMGLRIARKHAGWYFKQNEVADYLRCDFNRLDSANAQLDCLQHIFETLIFDEGRAA